MLSLAQLLYQEVADLPIISPHGHTDAAWFAYNEPFTDPTALLITPDHYVYRMLYSQGISLTQLGIDANQRRGARAPDPAEVWQLFAAHYHLFRGTPTRIWLDHVFAEVFGIEEPLTAQTASAYYERMTHQLTLPEFRPRALFERFNIELLATTESPLDELQSHSVLQADTWSGRVITTFRPDPVVDPDYEHFADNIATLGRLSGEDTTHFDGYLRALRERRAFFRAHGATATDHGHPTARTANLAPADVAALYSQALNQGLDAQKAELFRAHMLVEMATMSLEDGMVMQLHPGVYRNHNPWLFEQYGRDRGADIPQTTTYVEALKPLLDKYGNEPAFKLILFTLDETTYARELAPLAGHYPCLTLGPPWWFNDSPEGMRRFRRATTETAGFYNTAGFNDDTRAFLSIPARHDLARRIDCGFLAQLVAEHALDENEAVESARQLAYGLAKRAYRL